MLILEFFTKRLANYVVDFSSAEVTIWFLKAYLPVLFEEIDNDYWYMALAHVYEAYLPRILIVDEFFASLICIGEGCCRTVTNYLERI